MNDCERNCGLINEDKSESHSSSWNDVLKETKRNSKFLGYDDIWKRKYILLSLRAGVGSYIHSPLAWLVLTMIVRKQKFL